MAKMANEQSQPIPIEKGWPLLGVLPKILSGDPFEYLKNVMLERGGLVQIKLGPKSAYLVSHPDYLKHILWENYHNYNKPEMHVGVIREVAGNGLVTSSGDLWLRQRRMIQPHLHRKQMVNLFSEMRESITEILDRWASLAKNGTEVELGAKMGEITMNVTARTMFGKGTLPNAELTEIGSHIMRIIRYIGTTLYSSMLPKGFPIPGRREFLQDLNATKETVNHIITKSRQNKEGSASLIHMLINSVDEESQQQMTEQQLFDEVMTIFIAGYETTATALSWLGVVLHKHPQVLEKLQAEIDQVLGGRIPSFEDVPRLTYTRQVFMEIMRMYTVIPFIRRMSNEADRLGNYEVPAGSLLLIFFHGTHHNPSVWDQPEVFDPERFTAEQIAGRHSFAYLPFGVGPRKCAGDEFALLEGPLAIAMILQRYNLNVIPGQTFESKFSGTQRARNGVKATLSIRAVS